MFLYIMYILYNIDVRRPIISMYISKRLSYA